jgi:asparagine synthase (glutamine-hydrolysing)
LVREDEELIGSIMCGIAGIFHYDSDRLADVVDLRRMTDCLTHRGPDADGIYTNGPIGLGSRRLKIIDLTDNAAQPMTSQDNRYVLVFNGEIYNYRELRAELEKRGYFFTSQSDTEVLSKAFQEWRVGCLEKLIGMFAFAIWDNKEQRLFVARDRVGEKPLIYANVGGSFYFASEIQALRSNSDIPSDLDLEALHLYLVHMNAIPAPYTAFKALRKLPPGYAMIVDAAGIHISQWWKMNFSQKRNRSLKDEATDFRDLFATVMRDVSHSDVPNGVLLSGGVDSSIVAYELSQIRAEPIGFSLGFQSKEGTNPEMDRATQMSKLLGIRQYAQNFHPDEITALPEILVHYGEPFGNGTMLYTDELFRLVSSQVTVAIGGNGTDEVFGGYSSYNQMVRWPRLKKVAGLAGRWLHLTDEGDHGWRKTLARYSKDPLEATIHGLRQRSVFLRQHFEGSSLAQGASSCDPGALIAQRWKEAEAVEPLDARLYSDLMVTNHHTYSELPDTTGMRHSLEVRAPFLDARILDFAQGLPTRYKVPYWRRPELNKIVVKRAYTGRLPDSVLYARKLGFGYGILFADMLRKYWFPLVQHFCLDGVAAESGLVDPSRLRTMLEEHRAEKADWGSLIWLTLVMEIWLRRCVRNEEVDLTAVYPGVSVAETRL